MQMIFNGQPINMGVGGFNINAGMEEIQKICADHIACINCPVLTQGGLHHDNEVTICEKVAESIVKEQRNNAKVQNN